MIQIVRKFAEHLRGVRVFDLIVVALLTANLIVTVMVLMRPPKAGQQPILIVGEDADLADLRYRLEQLEDRVFLTGYSLPEKVTICGRPVPLDNRDVYERLEREFLSMLNYRFRVVDLLKKSTRYFPTIERIFREHGLPDDLKYLIVAESDLNVKALSSAGASGIAQFIPTTARRYRLTVDDQMDERRHFEKSLHASAAYLGDLYGMFHDWPLALAAYNAGEERVKREIVEQGVHDYYRLKLPLETERYVFRIIAAKLVLSHPEEYGFHPDDEAFYRPIPFDSVRVHVTKPIPIREIARACRSTYRDIRELNPELLDNAIPPGIRWIRVPQGTASIFSASFKG